MLAALRDAPVPYNTSPALQQQAHEALKKIDEEMVTGLSAEGGVEDEDDRGDDGESEECE